MFASAMRFYPLLQEEFITIQDALKARGSDLLVKWYNPIRLIWGVVMTAIPMGLGGLRRSRNIALSMELRGFSFPEETGVQRQLFRDIQLRTVDYVVIAVWVGIVVAVALLRITGVWSSGTVSFRLIYEPSRLDCAVVYWSGCWYWVIAYYRVKVTYPNQSDSSWVY